MAVADTPMVVSPAMDDEEEDEVPTEPFKRKHKSLLTLCKRFLELYPLEMPPGSSSDIPLEHLSEKLKLSRRRLYDIINIMECLQMAVKVTKNLYRWYGTRNVQKLLTQLKHLSDQEMSIELDKLTSNTELVDSPVPTQPPCTPQGNACAQSLLLWSLTQPTPASTKTRHCNLINVNESPEPKGPRSWKMKSLGGTCLKFLTLFFKHKAVSLDWAGRVLLCGPEDEKPSSQSSQDSSSQSSSQDSVEVEDELNPKEQDRQLRNKVRRIYDVANVLCALGLVCKIRPKHHNSRKLLYAYCGPSIGNSLQPFPIQGEATLMKPSKPTRRAKPLVMKEKFEPRSNSEGLCKRKLDLGNCSDIHDRKKAIVDEVMLQLDESSSPMSVLLAVAERELEGLNMPKPEPVKALELSTTSQGSKFEKIEVHSTFENKKIPSPTQVSQTIPKKVVTNQENKLCGGLGIPILPKDATQNAKSVSGGRSALRSLLENNQNKSAVKSDFPAIRKFVVCNETNVQQGRQVFITPATACHIRSPIQTVRILNPPGVIRRGMLSIPWQLNHIGTSFNQPFTTHLSVSKSDIDATHKQQ